MECLYNVDINYTRIAVFLIAHVIMRKKNLVFSVIFADKRKSPRKSLEIHLFFLRGFFTLVKFACARLQINPTNLYVKDVDIRKYDRHISDQEILFDCFT